MYFERILSIKNTAFLLPALLVSLSELLDTDNRRIQIHVKLSYLRTATYNNSSLESQLTRGSTSFVRLFVASANFPFRRQPEVIQALHLARAYTEETDGAPNHMTKFVILWGLQINPL